MSSISATVLKSLIDITQEVASLDDQYEEIIDKCETDYRRELETLLRQRQDALDANEEFWSSVLASESAPTTELMNEAADPRIVRSVRSLQIVTNFRDDGTYTQRVTLKIRPNLFIGDQELFKEFHADGKPCAKSGVQWKPGMQKARQDSFFRFFEEDNEEADTEAFKALENVFHNPFGYLEAANN
jgi:hypothetical protein